MTDVPTASTTDEPTPSPTPEPAEPGTRIVASGSEFGQMLFDGTGQAIYLFDIETTSKPTCYDACAEAWPPVLTKGDPVAGRGVESSLLATTDRGDGTIQVTYNDHPLYFYAHEGKREVKCHDIFLNGGNWYVVQPGGDPAPPG
jgi:predicted lipoprotein with Yx(FWY)xxD motif